MKTPFLLLAFACLTIRFATAQSTATRSFMIGPTIGIDKMTYTNTAGYVGDLSAYSSPVIANYGLDASYQVNRFLVGVKALYRQQAFQQLLSVIPVTTLVVPQPQFNRDLRVISVPITVGYRLTPEAHFQWYIGATVAADYLLSTANETLFDGANTLPVSNSDKSELGRSLNVGFGAQTTLRYQLTPVFSLQLEPAMRYYPHGGFPTRTQNNYQYQSTLSVLVKL
ncbi:hypothetical protein [uncultured Fibrella sp.]|uniref:hypothetical protein n=1 Tax=uncultured Fibrella sp. TaxID=1284596 RepID=UPI0035CAC15E